MLGIYYVALVQCYFSHRVDLRKYKPFLALHKWCETCAAFLYMNSLLYNRPGTTDTTIAGYYWHLFKHATRPRREECSDCLNNPSQFREMRRQRHEEGLKVKLWNEENHKESRTDCSLWNNLENFLLWS